MTGGPILALGGGGFTMEPLNPRLDDLVLELADGPKPRVLFLPTAGGDDRDQVAAFQARFDRGRCTPSVLSLFRLGDDDRRLERVLAEQDAIYVGGGSMRNLLALWRVHGVDDLLREAHRRGAVLAGLSAGAMCWFRGGISTSTGEAAPADGLGLLPGSLSVHADADPSRRAAMHAAVGSGRLPDGWTADDDVGLLFREGRLTDVVTSRPGARAGRVRRSGDGVVEEPLAARLLPGRPPMVPAGEWRTREADVRAALRGAGGFGADGGRGKPAGRDGALQELRAVRELRRRRR